MQYVIYQKLSNTYSAIVSVFIVVYNYLFLMITKPVLSLVGFHLRTQYERLASITIFICMLIDSIFIPIMIGANFVEYANQGLNKIFTGKNTDFGAQWYEEVG